MSVEGDFDSAMEQILANPSVKVVVLFTSSAIAEGLYDAAARLDAGLQWVRFPLSIVNLEKTNQIPRC